MTSPMCVEELCRCRHGGCGCSQPPVPATPRGPGCSCWKRCSSGRCFPQVLAGSPSLLLSGLTVVTSLAAVHTVSSAQNIFTLHNTRRLIPALASPVSFAVRFWRLCSALFFFFLKLNDWNFCFDVFFKSILSKRFFVATEWKIIWRHLCWIQELLTVSLVRHQAGIQWKKVRTRPVCFQKLVTINIWDPTFLWTRQFFFIYIKAWNVSKVKGCSWPWHYPSSKRWWSFLSCHGDRCTDTQNHPNWCKNICTAWKRKCRVFFFGSSKLNQLYLLIVVTSFWVRKSVMNTFNYIYIYI